MRSSTLCAAAVLAALCPGAAAAGPWHKGIVFGGDEWTSPQTGFGTAASTQALTALAATGATHVRLIWTQYQDYENSTVIYPITGPSPLASTTLPQLESSILTAASLGLNITLCPILDPSWDIPSNGRSSDDNPNPVGGRPVSRLGIGKNFTEADWAAWFTSYRAYVMPFVALAAQHYPAVSMLEVASELDIAFTTRAGDWRALVQAVRAVYPGPLTIAANSGTAPSISWWDALDFIGLDMYQGLGSAVPLGTAPSVQDLLTAWQPILAQVQAVATTFGKQVILTEVGYQSRPSCHVRPWGTVDRDPLDDSAWIENHDPACQANAYEALLRAFTPQPWFGGVYWWLWRADPTHGGTGDSDFTPHGKPAEVVLRRWYGNYSCPAGGAYDTLLQEARAQAGLPADTPLSLTAAPVSMSGPAHPSFVSAYDRQRQGQGQGYGRAGSDSACDGSAAVAAAVGDSTAAFAASAKAARHEKETRSSRPTITKKTWNGFDLGGPDEWSSPYYRFDSPGARASVDAALALGADSLEVIAQWYFTNVTDPVIYPITDTANPLRTSTDDELLSIMGYIKGKGAKVILTPMLDPDWTLSAQNYCRGETGSHGCYWRGQYGQLWNGSDCSPGSPWHTFLTLYYTPMLVHYARLAQQAGADAFLTSHELQTAVSVCPALWQDGLAQVRAVFSGQVSSAFQPNLLDPSALATVPWAASLDFIGVDCYMGYPWHGHPDLPWQDLPQGTITANFSTVMAAYAGLSAATGKKVVCTEVGWASRPWTYTGPAGIAKLDPEDCSVWDQCVSMASHTGAYQAFFETYYTQPWFDGVLWWTWRADPTVGGTSDDGFSPAGKPSAGLIASFPRRLGRRCTACL